MEVLGNASCPNHLGNSIAIRGINRPALARIRVVDLDQVTSIDKDGEEVLRMMIQDGAEFVANGLYTKHLLDAMRAHHASSK